MIKVTMCSFCKICVKSVALYEEIRDKFTKVYHCQECKKEVRTVTVEGE